MKLHYINGVIRLYYEVILYNLYYADSILFYHMNIDCTMQILLCKFCYIDLIVQILLFKFYHEIAM